jgi:uncharacterized protein (UPF0548 family)
MTHPELADWPPAPGGYRRSEISAPVRDRGGDDAWRRARDELLHWGVKTRSGFRVGFSYRTLPGHPVDGEEAFILERSAAGIRLIVRSLTSPAPRGLWRALFPLLLIAQAVAHRRYLRALRCE